MMIFHHPVRSRYWRRSSFLCRLTYIVCATILMIGAFVIYCCIRRKRSSMGIASCMEPGVFKMANDEIMRLTVLRNALEASKFTQWSRLVIYNSIELFFVVYAPLVSRIRAFTCTHHLMCENNHLMNSFSVIAMLRSMRWHHLCMRSDDGHLFEHQQINAKRAISAHAICCSRRAHTVDVHAADYTTILVPESSSIVFFPRIHFERSNTGESENFIPLVHISEIEQAILPSPLDTTNRPASTGQMLSHRTTISAKSNKPNWRPTAASPSSLTLHLPPARAPTNEHSNQAISMQESSYECSTRSLEQEQRGYRRTP